MNADFQEVPHRIRSGELFLSATAHVPTGAESRVPCVVFCHGFTGNRIEQRRIFVRTARELARNGMAGFRFDYRGCGESEGEFRDFSILDYIEDTRAVLDFTAKLPGVDGRRIGILGYSLGGCVAAETAKSRPEIRTVVLWSPVAFPLSLFYEQGKDVFPRPENLFKEKTSVEYKGWEIGRGFIESLGKVDPVKSLASCQCPALICHGMNDTVVDPSHSRAYVEARESKNLVTKNLLLPKSDHGYTILQEEYVLLQETISWFLHHLLE
jgi:hypothetical protein